MGAGRSGTTALATFLGNNKEIQNIGEMHQFFEHIDENKECSCGKQINECEFWNNKITNNIKYISYSSGYPPQENNSFYSVNQNTNIS